MRNLNVYTVGEVSKDALKKLKYVLMKEFPIEEIKFSELGNFPAVDSKSFEQLGFMAQHFVTMLSLSGPNVLILISIQQPPKYEADGREYFIKERIKEGLYGGSGAHGYGAYVIFKELTDYALLVAVHEVAHIFGLTHCSVESCIMWSRTKDEESLPASAYSGFCPEHREKLKALK